MLNEKSSAPCQVEHLSHSLQSIAGDLRPEKMISIIVKSMGTLCDRQMSGMTRCDWTHPAEATMQQKALEQARSKLEDLTRKDVVSFSFFLSEEGVELCGEEQLTVDMMNLIEESGMIEVAQRIRMQGRDLHHRSTRQIKIEKLQDAF